MTVEIFIYRAQLFAVKMQNQRGFFRQLAMPFGGLITQFLMGLSFGLMLQKGEQQWQKQKSVKSANKKSVAAKKHVPSVQQTSMNLRTK